MGIFDRYRKVGLLGQGGMGQVFLGFDPVLERYVAIKQIGQSIIDHPENVTLLAYFEREAKVVAALQHPNIIQVFEFGLPVEEPAYIVTEFVDGITLEELVEARPGLPASALLPLLLPVAEALEYAHEREIVHRDLKPGNVMLSRHGRVYLMDFGLAKPLGTSGLKSMVIGSPSFMSPEQIEGKETDRRADVFSFGLLAWALATGELFFSSEAPRAFVEILTDTYPRKDQLDRLTDPDLRELVSRCVRRDLSQRASSMQEIIVILERAVARMGVTSPARECRRLAESWLDLMPQQYTPGSAAASNRDTSPALAVSIDAAMLAGDAYAPVAEPALRREDLLVARAVSEPELPIARLAFEEEPTLQRRPPDELPTRIEAHSEVVLSGDRAFHGAETVVVPADAETAYDVAHTEPRGLQVRMVVEHDDVPTQPTLRMAAEDRTRRRLFVPTAPQGVRPRAAALEVTAGLDDDALAQLGTLSRPSLGSRLLWLVAAFGGELRFNTLREWLEFVAPGESPQVPQALAELVDLGALERRGGDALGLHGDFRAVDVLLRMGRESAVARMRGPVLTRFMAEATDARERCDGDEAEEWLTRAALAARCDAAAPSPLVVDICLALAELALSRGQHEEARAQLDDAFGERGQTPRDACRIRLIYSELYALEGRCERARDALTDAIAGATEVGEAGLIASGALSLVALDVLDGELRRGRVRLHHELDRSPQVLTGRLRFRERLLAAELALWLDGKPGAVVDQLIVLLQSTAPDVALEGCAQLLLARALREDGQLAAAQDRVEQSRATARALGLTGLEADALTQAAALAREAGRSADAVRHARRGVGLAETLREGRRIGRARTELALALLAEGEVSSARSVGEEARAALLPFRLDRYGAELALAAVEATEGATSAARARLELLAQELRLRGLAWPLAQGALQTGGAGVSAYAGYTLGLREPLDLRILSAWHLS